MSCSVAEVSPSRHRCTSSKSVASGIAAFMVPAALAAAQLLTVGCIGRVSYPCQQDAQCNLGDGGACIDGYCAAVDGGCPSGYRFSEHSPDGAVCTPVAVADAGDTGTTTALTVTGGEASTDDGGPPNESGEGTGSDSGSGSGSAGSDTGGTAGCVASIEAGSGHLCALLTDGRVQCFGAADDPVVAPLQTPGRFGVTELPAVALAVGNEHACVIAQGEDSGVPFCWGFGQSGSISGIMNGETTGPLAQSGVGLPEDPRTVSVGDGSSCFAAEHEIGCLSQLAAVQQAASTDFTGPIVDFAVGRDHLCVVAGSVQCAGSNAFGQLGVPDDMAVFTTLDELPDVDAIASSGLSTCAWARGEGPSWCWGRDSGGQILGGTNDVFMPTMSGVADVRGLAMSARVTCVADAAGDTRCIGDEPCGSSLSSYEVTNPTADADDIAVANNFVCVIDSAGDVRCWGDEAVVGTLTGQPVVACDEFHTLPVDCG